MKKTRRICELNLTLVTKQEVTLKPAYTFTGGIEITLKDGRQFSLDFSETKWQEYKMKKKHCEIYICQRDLNEDYVKESNPKMKLEEMTDIQFIKDNAKSIAVYFEAEGKNEEAYVPNKFDEDVTVEFNVAECNFRACDEKGVIEEKEIDFTEITTLQ